MYNVKIDPTFLLFSSWLNNTKNLKYLWSLTHLSVSADVHRHRKHHCDGR